MLYFDHAASSKMWPKVEDILIHSIKSDFGNPSSTHRLGKDLYKEIEEIRARFCQILGDDFVFTSSATESNNMILKGLELKAGERIWLEEGGHPSLSNLKDYFQTKGIIVQYLPFSENGKLDLKALLLELDNRDKLLALSETSGQSGVLQFSPQDALEVKEKFPNLWIHVDASQSFLKINIDYKKAEYDSIAISSHKIGGPLGIAGCFIKMKTSVHPLIIGGGHEMGMRSSTLSISLIKGFGQALNEFFSFDGKKVASFKSKLIHELKENCPGITFPFESNKDNSAYILGVELPSLSSDIMLRFLEVENVFISANSACSSKNKKENKYLKSLGMSEREQQSYLRISLSPLTTNREIDEFIKIFSKVYNDLMALKK